MLKKFRSSMTFNLIGAIILLLVIFGIIVSAIGLISFTNAFNREYATSTFHIADTAATLINGDHIDEYLKGEEMEEYERSASYLDSYCKAINVSLIYVIKVDTSDYGRFVSVFNSVNNSVDNTGYTAWEIGYERDTTNDEYRSKYEALYNKETRYETIYRTNPSDGVHPHVTTLIPITDSAGDVVSILCVQRPAGEVLRVRKPYLINIAISTLVLAIIITICAGAYLRAHIAAPIRKVSEEATRFADMNTKGKSLEQVSRIEEIANLAGSIDKMETDMLKYIEDLTSVTAENERIETELSLASRIQENSVPDDWPAFPDRSDFDIYASMTPAKEVGGDFYNFYLIDEDHLAIVIGDVSGKGVPAALFMMVTNILISERTRSGKGPGEILASVNNDLCAHNRAEMFVTVWLGILDLKTGAIKYANAGHEDPAVYRKDSGFELLKEKHGFVCGGMEGIAYKEYDAQLNKGDKLFIYTDGVPEATDASENMFGIDRMLETLNEYGSTSCKEILEGIRLGVDEFVGEAPQFDDLTMLCLEYL
ncbi:MAG: PP2C family protein-serine/threonine phosphatase [Lachnospiraceae bacterium]|nr:PP2C family protein-serine/threonine phosphatase [Lachnospiraceae bacterium]